MATPRKPRQHPALSETQLEAVARRFRALAVPSRLRIVNALMNGPLAMAELADETGLAPSNLSRQITELELVGCVLRERSGRDVTVHIADPTLHQLCELVCGSLAKQVADKNREMQRPASRR